MTVRPKEFRFPVAVEWLGGRRVGVRVEGKHTIEVAPPPQFRGTDPSAWSPEDFLVGAAASCLAVTFTGLAARAGLAYSDLRLEGYGVCGLRDDGRFGFTRLFLWLELETAASDTARARALAEEAEQTCLVAASLALPVEVAIDVRPTAEPRALLDRRRPRERRRASRRLRQVGGSPDRSPRGGSSPSAT
jgi:organic hydroperoxide reductase OsmC/OhrA